MRENIPTSFGNAKALGLVRDEDSPRHLVQIWNSHKFYAPVQLKIPKKILDRLVRLGTYEKMKVYVYSRRSIRHIRSANIYRRKDDAHIYIRPFSVTMLERWDYQNTEQLEGSQMDRGCEGMSEKKRCPACGGTGMTRFMFRREYEPVRPYDLEVCKRCNGSGKITSALEGKA